MDKVTVRFIDGRVVEYMNVKHWETGQYYLILYQTTRKVFIPNHGFIYVEIEEDE